MRHLKTLYFCTFLLFLNLVCYAQNWSPLGGDTQSVFSTRDSIGPVKGTRYFLQTVESENLVSGGMEYKFRPYGMLMELNFDGWEDYFPAPSFLGKKIIYDSVNGATKIFTKIGTTFFSINWRKEIGAVSLIYNDGFSSILGVVTRKWLEVVGGHPDSLKTIRLSYSNLGPSSRNLKIGDSIVISKTKGLITFFDLGEFPDRTFYLRKEFVTEDTLSSWFGKVYDGAILPGDVFHVKTSFILNSQQQAFSKYDEYEVKVDSVFQNELKINVLRQYPGESSRGGSNFCFLDGSVLQTASCKTYSGRGILFESYNSEFAPDLIRTTTGPFPIQYTYCLFKGDNGLAYRISKRHSFNSFQGAICPGLNFSNFDLAYWVNDTWPYEAQVNIQIPVYFYSPSRNFAIGTPIPNFSVLNWSQRQLKAEVRISNPANEYAEVSGLSHHASISIFNTLGQCILKKELQKDANVIPVMNLPSGIYLYHLLDINGSLISGKFLKN